MDQEINDLITRLRRERNNAEARHLASHPLPISDKHRIVAEQRATEYFKTHYDVGGIDAEKEQYAQ